MPFSQDNQAIVQTMANEKGRVACDRIVGLYQLLNGFLGQYAAQYQPIIDAADDGDVLDPDRIDMPNKITVGEFKDIVAGLDNLKQQSELAINNGLSLIQLCTKFAVNPGLYSK